jgi:eukaryotic-like serine/threonine-protein kinase
VPVSAGSHLGRYEVVSPLGAGGTGEVYRVRDPRLGREVAIKVLRASCSNRCNHAPRPRSTRSRSCAGSVATDSTVAVLSHPDVLAIFDIVSRYRD